MVAWRKPGFAALAQSVEQLPRKEQVRSSILLGGSQKSPLAVLNLRGEI